jgi:hypothetical protein
MAGPNRDSYVREAMRTAFRTRWRQRRSARERIGRESQVEQQESKVRPRPEGVEGAVGAHESGVVVAVGTCEPPVVMSAGNGSMERAYRRSGVPLRVAESGGQGSRTSDSPELAGRGVGGLTQPRQALDDELGSRGLIAPGRLDHGEVAGRVCHIHSKARVPAMCVREGTAARQPFGCETLRVG